MNDQLTLIAGPCVIESKELLFEVAEEVKKISKSLNIKYIFKASFDKANRSSYTSFRGFGLKKGLQILEEVKIKYGLEILTDIHDLSQVDQVAEVVDVIQIPAFLCRQTDLIVSAARSISKTGKCLNIKKGQFLAPWDMEQVVKKAEQAGINRESKRLWITERGTSFGYNNLVVDFRGLEQLKSFGCPVIFDATHSVQHPGGRGTSSGGQREFVAPLARAAIAVGINGLFIETHPDPNNALSDGPNMIPLSSLENLLEELIQIRMVVPEKPSKST